MPAIAERREAGLSASDRADLSRLERIIDRGHETLREVSLAILEIRDRRLYRSEFYTFDSYCRQRWGFSRRYANQLCEAAQLILECERDGIPPPTCERQARRILNARKKPSISEPELLAKSIEEERPSVRRTREIERHLAELRDLHQGHPHETKAEELLRFYAAVILPWPDGD